MAPKYPYGGSVSEGELYIDALRQVDADAEAARRLAEAASPKPPGAVRIAGTNPNALARLRSLGARVGGSPAGRFLGRYGAPLVDVGFGALEVDQARREGKNVPRAIGKEVVEILGGAGAATLPGLFGVPSGGATLVAVPAAYVGGSMTAGALYDQVMDQVMGEDITEQERINRENPGGYREVTVDADGQLVSMDKMGPSQGSVEFRRTIFPEKERTLVGPPPMVPPDAAIVVGDEIESQEPVREKGSPAALPGQSTTLSTPKAKGDDMQSELLRDAMTMRRAKEMAELGIYGGEQATTKGSDMYKWVQTHGDLADNLIRDKRMKEVRIARMFGRDLPTDAAGMDGQMGNFEAFEGMREMA